MSSFLLRLGRPGTLRQDTTHIPQSPRRDSAENREYVSDRGSDKDAVIQIPKGGGFKDKTLKG